MKKNKVNLKNKPQSKHLTNNPQLLKFKIWNWKYYPEIICQRVHKRLKKTILLMKNWRNLWFKTIINLKRKFCLRRLQEMLAQKFMKKRNSLILLRLRKKWVMLSQKCGLSMTFRILGSLINLRVIIYSKKLLECEVLPI